MPIHIRVARSARELEAVYIIRAQVRRESGIPLPPGSADLVVDRFDTFATTTNLIISDGSTPVGALRIAEEGELGLPADALYDFSSIRRYLTGQVMGVDHVSLLRAYRSRPGILIAATKVALQVMRGRGAHHLLALLPGELAPVLEGVGLSPVGPPQWCDAVQGYLTPLYCALSSLRSPFVEWLQDPAFDALADTLSRSIFSMGEVIFREGDAGECAYAVARGSVCVTAMGPGDQDVLIDILGPGELFGELALLDAGRRMATVRAYSAETDLIVLERSTFQETVFGDRVRTEALFRLLAHRLRGSSARMVSFIPRNVTPFLVQVLIDAAVAREVQGSGLLPGVTIEWLAGQVGRPPGLIRDLTAVLELDGLVSWRAEGLFVKDLDQLKACHEELQGGEEPARARRSEDAGENDRMTQEPLERLM